MLIELRLRNVAVIDAVTLHLTAGLNVLTGETGAGKSLIVGALGMLLGDRAAADRVRAGSEKAMVEGIFELGASHTIREALGARGIDADDELLMLKREIGANGRSRAWINGAPVTAAVLAEIGALLVSVHGQHDSRQLLDGDHQRDLLDDFVGATSARQRVAQAHAEHAALLVRERDIETRHRDAERRADYLRFVVREIEAAKPVDSEEVSLEQEIRRLSHAGELRALASQASVILTGDDSAIPSQWSLMRRTLAALSRIDEEAARWHVAFDGAVYALDELSRELDSYAERIEVDPERLRALETRRDLLLALQRKYGPSMAEVREVGRHARAELDLVDGGAQELRSIADARTTVSLALTDAAAELTRCRAAGAQQLAAAVTTLLPELGMPGGTFSVELTTLDAIGEFGAESVEFLAALNVGSEPRALPRIASGGELARLLLALSTVLARLQQVPTLVFDEVDAGIGGAVAWQVGALMRRVAGHHQVLAISHLAQIAARAHHHVVVRKGAIGTVTTADTAVVVDDDRVVEIARMLGGDADREVSRAHARELLVRGAEEPVVATRRPPARPSATRKSRVDP